MENGGGGNFDLNGSSSNPSSDKDEGVSSREEFDYVDGQDAS